MEENLFTAGEFAKLARTTKRTVLWYAEKGILKPYKIDDSRYRLYRPEQIIDFQSILLMRKLGFSVADIQAYIEQGQSLQDLFKAKSGIIEQQIVNLERMLADTKDYYANLAQTGTLVMPTIKQQEPFEIYYLDKIGPYAKIKDYLEELQSRFGTIPKTAVFLTIFMDSGFRPKNANMRIGMVCDSGLQGKVGSILPKTTMPKYTALCHSSYGTGALLSLLWQELDKYRANEHLSLDNSLPFTSIEIYRNVIDSFKNKEVPCTAELHLPIKDL